ncbi:MAG: hypothetical protein IGR93_04655 [Hydrococcus sp. C42_A2020_068]|nr:hypothetical protein Ple7327_0207 [Pleurocapsa sp. PCC 7327]MBF2019409.1 hypothetical protein [Hydrococcus sp. C42_A2020_068]
MSAAKPLQGIELINCARANAKLGLETATWQCGYGDDPQLFLQNLQFACHRIGIDIEHLKIGRFDRRTTNRS